MEFRFKGESTSRKKRGDEREALKRKFKTVRLHRKETKKAAQEGPMSSIDR